MNMYPLRVQMLQLHSIVSLLGVAVVSISLCSAYSSPRPWDRRAVERRSHRMQMLHNDMTPYLNGQSIRNV
jgi:hypothetical protein